MRGLKDKTAIVAGGAGGIGSAICRRLCEEGVRVVCADASERRGLAVVDELRAAGGCGEVRFAALDAGAAESWSQLAAWTVGTFGTPHILVNAFYAARGGPLEALSDDDWRANLRVTLDGVFYGMREIVPLMTSGGAVVNIASVAGHLGMPVNTGYGAAKAAVAGLTRSVAVTYAPRNIRVNSISPGFVQTRALDGLGDLMSTEAAGGRDAALAGLLDRTPTHAFGRPCDIAAATAFLASDDASFITGTDLVIDGGYTVA
jgi:NAD(P)-dependent dehydrogenase (short-subunit alcohol dehydrogenase family)